MTWKNATKLVKLLMESETGQMKQEEYEKRLRIKDPTEISNIRRYAKRCGWIEIHADKSTIEIMPEGAKLIFELEKDEDQRHKYNFIRNVQIATIIILILTFVFDNLESLVKIITPVIT